MKNSSRRVIRRPFFALLWLVILGFAFLAHQQTALSQTKAAWQERWEKTLSEAKKESKVVVLGPPGDLIRNAMTEGFKKAFPFLEVEYSGGRSGEQAVKLRSERDAGVFNADVFLGGPTTANFQLKPMGALDPIKAALILPQVTDPKNWRDNKLEFSDNDGLYDLVFVTQASPMLIYDPKQVKRSDIDEVYELLDPKLKGKIVINDPLVSGSGVPVFRFLW
jgi:ABC-type thiamine transport system substrate-binding protein